MIHSFLLIGQSNMAGRGIVSEVEPIINPGIKMLRNGRWHDMHVPVNPDNAFSGICMAESFANAYQKEYNVDVGLIPCAEGGTRLDEWQKGSLLYDNAVFQAKLASRTSVLTGVLWHQGESDCHKELCDTYSEKFQKFINDIKIDLELDNVPFVTGGLGDFLSELDEWGTYYPLINRQIEEISGKNHMMGYVTAAGLTSNEDNLHFNSKSLREFGLRYYNEFKRLKVK